MKQAVLAVPAAALMLGASEAGTTVGLNFQAWYYDSGAIPQTVGYGWGYQTTGFPVTAKAFGVEIADWKNTDPLDCRSRVLETIPFGSGLTATVDAANMWQTGWLDVGSFAPWEQNLKPAPGDYEVTWGMVDNTGWSIGLSGLNAKFPNGYVVQLIGAGKTTATSSVGITNTASDTLLGTVTFTLLPDGMGLGSSPELTADAITLFNFTRSAPAPDGAKNCALGGLIVTDKPVVSQKPANVTVNQGASLTLSAGVIGLAPISYQWQHAGTNVPGATTVPFSKTATPADAGSWVLVATNASGAGTSVPAEVTVNQVPLITKDLSPNTNNIYAGFASKLSVAVGGAEPLSYQWIKDGNPIAGATDSSYTAANLTAGLSGYRVVITNAYGSANSATSYLKVVASPDVYTAQVGQDGPLAYWPLNESTGETAVDYAGFGHNGVISNSMTLGVAGPRPPAFPGFASGTTAYQFSGADSFVYCGTEAALSGNTDFTLEAWVNTTSTTFARLIQQRSGYLGEYMFDIKADGTVAFVVYGTGGYQFNLSTSSKVNDGKWHHIAAVRSGTNGLIYIDGGLAAQGTGPMRALDPTFIVTLGVDYRDINTGPAFFNGSLCNVAIYDKALTSSRLVGHYVTGSGTQLKLQLASGGMIEDTKPVGTRHPGRNNNSTWVASSSDTAAPPVTRSGVQQFATSSSSQIVIPADTDFNSTSGTICFWMRFDALAAGGIPGPGNDGALLFDRRLVGDAGGGDVIVLNDSGAIFWQTETPPGRTRVNTGEVGYLPDGLWHHVAYVYDQSAAGFIAIYIDGALAINNPNTGAWSWPAGAPIELGRSHDTWWKRFDGQMDDFRMYNRILTEAEIASIKTSDALVDTAALKVRYNFNNAIGVGQSVTWPLGTLMSSPTLGPDAVWTPVSGATPPKYSFMPTESSLFYRAQY